MFYHFLVASVIFYAVVSWGSWVKTAHANRLNKLIRKAGYVMGVELESLVEVCNRRMQRKLLSILDNVSHPLQAATNGNSIKFEEYMSSVTSYFGKCIDDVTITTRPNCPKPRMTIKVLC
ncbi:hypothetical protein QTP70_006433 [Hemibagrus guttatus]|uniref:Uncharacterized protein n=1 Tax=Hemibagrus guttatus TaxID=175788 RepID=A0AAE0UI65_9TELE|nr:hypothetical protein QTP70_006433 [Hemibagrus guttatus]